MIHHLESYEDGYSDGKSETLKKVFKEINGLDYLKRTNPKIKRIGTNQKMNPPQDDLKKEKKGIYDYKIGEVNEEDMMNGIMKAPNKLVKIGYTFQDKNQTQMEVSLKHKDFIEDEDY